MSQTLLLSTLRALCLAAPAILVFTARPPTADACQEAQDARESVSYEAEPGLRDVVDAFNTDYSSLRRFYPIEGSDRRAQRLREFLTSWEAALAKLNYSSLDLHGRIEYLLLRAFIQHEFKTLKHDEAKLADVQALAPFGNTLIALEEDRAQMRPVDARAAASTQADVSRQVQDLRRRVEAAVAERQRRAGRGRGEDEAAPTTGPSTGPAPATGPIILRSAASSAASRPGDAGGVSIDATQAVRAAEHVTNLQQALRRWNEHYAQFNPEFAWWNAEPYAKLSRALDDYAKLLRERVAGVRGEDNDPLLGDPIGRQALLDDLEGEMVDYTPEELIQIARRELAWCHEQRLIAARELGFGDDWKAAVEKVKNDFVPPGKQDEYVREQAREAINYVIDKDLVTVPELCRETWQLDMLDSRRQRLWPFANYGGQRMNVAYATSDMEHERKLEAMRGNNIHFTRTVTPHELVPGHHLQGFMAQRYRPWRRMFSTPFYGEGWALHWEMLFWDLEYARTPEERLGMLVWRSHRAARIIVSLAYHLGEMTPSEMIEFLVENVGFERDNATGEVRRFIGDQYSPLYQCGYMIGGLQIRSLYKELVEGGQVTPRQFHDEVLKQNSVPITMVRAALLRLPLQEPVPPRWRFYGELAEAEPASP